MLKLMRSIVFAVFEPETFDSKEYREIYQEYKNLVDLLLGCYMEDIGITPEQFERACTLNKSSRVPVQFQQVITQLDPHSHIFISLFLEKPCTFINKFYR